ncbi:MAG: insulinase family protein [Blastomonas sp.]
MFRGRLLALAAFLPLVTGCATTDGGGAAPPTLSEQSASDLRPPNLLPGEEIPWLYRDSNIPVDKAWTFGELNNGLRYAVRHNGVPPGQVSVRIVIDAGALMEEDDEQGYAHLLEHLTFRGSKYVPDGEAIRIWQRLGAGFGSDSNAETTQTHTVYKLDLPDATAQSFDESMKIISGMIREPGLTGAAVTAEVPVVIAELRERSGAQARVGDATREHFFAGQLLADRSTIGTPETLNAATPAAVRAFHNRWYRPENTIIVIAGDGDPAAYEEAIRRYYADWKLKGGRTPEPDFGDPDPAQPQARVLVEPDLPYLISAAMMRPWHKKNDTIAYNQGLLIDLVAQQIINRRLEARARGGGSYLQAGVSQDDVSRSVDGTFISIVPIGSDWQAALTDVRSVIADAMAAAPTQEEIDREVTELDAAFEILAETSETEAGSKQAENIVNAVDIRETVASQGVALEIFRGMKAMFTPERLLEATRELFASEAQRVMLVTPEPIADGEQELAELFTRDIGGDSGARLAASSVSFDDLPDLGEPGTVESSTDIQLLGMEIITFSNGVRALLYPNDAEVSKIDLKVRFGRGYQAFPANQPSLLWSGEAALVQSGVGDLGQEELDRLATGRRIGFGFEVENDAFSFSAYTRPADLEDELKLLAAKLAYPRWDPAPVIRARAAAKLAYPTYAVSPQLMLERDLQWLTHDRDPRWKTPGPDEIDMLTPEAFRATWEPILKQGPIEVMLFGDFNRDEAVAMLARTFGALPRREEEALVGGPETVAFPAPGTQPERLYHSGTQDQAAVYLAWPTGGGIERVRESRQLEILSEIFTNRLIEKLRSEEGASYAPQVINSWPTSFDKGGHLAVISQLSPDNLDKLYSVVNTIVDDLVANPVSEDELSRATEPLRQIVMRASTGNGFWLQQLEGAAFDVRRISAIRTILSDYSVTTPETMQALARKYLREDSEWRLEILPQSFAGSTNTADK